MEVAAFTPKLLQGVSPMRTKVATVWAAHLWTCLWAFSWLLPIFLINTQANGASAQKVMSICGRNRLSSRMLQGEPSSQLTGGVEAPLGEWPWQIRLGAKQGRNLISWFCGGSIISENYILTAAHCLESGPNAQYVVRVGDHNANAYEQGEEDYAVLRWRIHPMYNKADNFANDIAILRLARPIRYHRRVTPICLPHKVNEEPAVGTTCMVTGWGMIGAGNAPFSSVLRQGRVVVLSRFVCRDRSYWGPSVKDSNICAGYPDGHVDACKGDSGGPLVCYDEKEDHWSLQGLVSFGWDQGCGFAKKPAIYTKVSSYLNWIHLTTGNTV
ncbi:hypothetical protein RvY_12461-2 [Ramazzottius varieornatus]|uniref:Peptidase S1 domain-containing protein n=1 Tax=Ramazzottius varieornatus TaxID=947166 RepID=A0A1D1VLJ6_RAMVA|nr:hypothetical protein RvY_12461-2 [Ramazzottius varieornatus]